MSVHDGAFSLSLSEWMAVGTIVGLSDQNKAHSRSHKSHLDNSCITTAGKFSPFAKVFVLFDFVFLDHGDGLLALCPCLVPSSH